MLGLGASVGARERTLRDALDALAARLGPLRVGPLVESTPVLRPGSFQDSDSADHYLNTVALAHLPSADPDSLRGLLRAVKALEIAAGRRRAAPDAPRPLDIDLLIAGDQNLELPAVDARPHGPEYEPTLDRGDGPLVVPHPRLAERLFVLEPLRAVAPRLLLPLGTTTAAQTVASLHAEVAARLSRAGQIVRRRPWRAPDLCGAIVGAPEAEPLV
ncbi:MAG: 2-amino-4-hydroxy-6-hydroxymethyldihydropteridine diphosphokinase [Acidobacteriota bacterium]